jgi:hypothetical protein
MPLDRINEQQYILPPSDGRKLARLTQKGVEEEMGGEGR